MTREAIGDDFGLADPQTPLVGEYGLDVMHPAVKAAFAQRRAAFQERNERERLIALEAQRERERRMRAEEAGEL